MGFSTVNLDASLESVKNSAISEKNKKLILEFHNYGFSRGLTVSRINKYIYSLRMVAEKLGKDLDTATKEDIIKLIIDIEKSKYADWTKHDYKWVIKKFYKWIEGDEEYPAKVKWIKTYFKKSNNKLPEDILREEDILKMIEFADHPRDKAIVSVLYESGCRVAEIGTLNIKHIAFDQYGAKIIVSGKTGMRRVRLVSSVPHLSAWVSAHPLNKNPEAPLWVGIGTRSRRESLSYSSIRQMLQELAVKAGIQKRVNPHSFRHARATNLAQFLTEAQMKEFFGWVQASEMASIYVHLSGRDVDNALLKINGIKIEDQKHEEIMRIINCPRCDNKNPPGGQFCTRCGLPLNVKSAMELERKTQSSNELMNELVKNPEVQKVLIEEMIKKGLAPKMLEIFGDKNG